MQQVYLFREGERIINTGERSGDGPLSLGGTGTVITETRRMVRQLFDNGIEVIDEALVSGSICGAMTFGEIWRIFHQTGIRVNHYLMSKNFFSIEHEDAMWKEMYKNHGDELRAEIERVGEKAAVMKYAGNLVEWAAGRTMDKLWEVLRSGAKTVLVVTNGPHDCFISEKLTCKVFDTCLELGKYRMIEIPKM